MTRTHTAPLLALTLALAACSTAATTPDQNPGVGRRYLVLGEVQSPVYDALRRQANNTFAPYRDASPPAYDALLVDGDAFSSERLAAEPALGQALQAGKWVLALDVNAEHKRQALKPHVLMASEGHSTAFLMARGTLGNHTANFVFDDRPGSEESDDALAGPTLALQLRPQQTITDASAVAQQLEQVMAKTPFAQPSTLRALNVDLGFDANSVPPNALAYFNTYTTNSPRTLKEFYDDAELNLQGGPAPQQTANALVTYHFWVFLNTTPTLRSQFVAFDVNGTFDPGPIALTRNVVKFDDPQDSYEVGYYQDAAGITIEPAAPGLNTVQASPLSAKDTPDVTSSVALGVRTNAIADRANDAGGAPGFVYEQRYTTDLNDWLVESTPTGHTGGHTWRYSSHKKIDGTINGIKKYPPSDPEHAHAGALGDDSFPIVCSDNGFFLKLKYRWPADYHWGCYPETLNRLNANPIVLRPQVTWSTGLPGATGDVLLTTDVPFTLTSLHHMSLLYRQGDGVTDVDGDDVPLIFHRGYTFTTRSTVHVDMEATIPRRLQSLSLEGDGQTLTGGSISVKGGSVLQGKLTLAAPVKIKTHVFPVLEHPTGLRVEPDVLVLNPGEQTATFQVKTSPVTASTSSTLKWLNGDVSDPSTIQLTP